MTKFEELKALFESLPPGEWEAQDNTTAIEYAGWEIVNMGVVPQSVFAVGMPEREARFAALAHNLMPELLEAVNLLDDLIDYAESSTLEGDELPPAAVDGRTLLRKLRGGPADIPTLEETVERMKTEIMFDMEDGQVPRTVRSFGELHEYVDANCYGGFCHAVADRLIEHFGGRDSDEGMPQGMLDYINAAQDAIDAWLKGFRK